MAHILLTHGYFLSEDEKERQIMKPYPPLGLLYLSAYLKARGHSVEVYDSTFGTRAELVQRIRASPGGLVGVYTNLVTRRSVLQIIKAAREVDATVILGGPESANYSSEYLNAGADVVVIGEGESTLTEVIATLPSLGPHGLHAVRGIAFKERQRRAGAHTRASQDQRSRHACRLPDREAIDHHKYLDAWRTHHGASSINLITARGCPYRCNWCSHAVYGFSHRRRSPGKCRR